MRIPLAAANEIIDIRPFGATLAQGEQTTLVKTDDVEVSEIALPAGEKIPTYGAQGEVILHCLEGRLLLTAAGKTRELLAGQLLYLSAGERFSMLGIDNASLLVTVVLPKKGPSVELIGE